MLYLPDRAGVGSRINEILKNGQISIADAAERLRFETADVEDALRGHPTLSMLIGVVRHFGIDPTWLLTGVYNAASHRAALEDPFDAVYAVLRRLDSPRPIDPEGGFELAF